MTDSFATVDSCNSVDHAYGSEAHITRGASRVGRLGSSNIGEPSSDSSDVLSESTESVGNQIAYNHPDWLLPDEHQLPNWNHDFGLKIEDVLAEIKQRKNSPLAIHKNTKPFKRLLFLFDSRHIEQDLKNTVEAFCKKYNMRPMSGAAHRDEGSVETSFNRETNKAEETVKYNFHYHLMFTNVIPGQKLVSAIGGKGETSLMQDFFADQLSMRRGVGKYAPAVDESGKVIIRTEGKHKGKPLFATQTRREHIKEEEFRRQRIVQSKENMKDDIRWLAEQKAKLTAENQELKAILEGDKQTKKNLNVVNVVARQQLIDLGIGEPEHYAELKNIKDTFCKGKVSIAEVFHRQMSMIAQLRLGLDEMNKEREQKNKEQLSEMKVRLVKAERQSLKGAETEDLLEAVEARLRTGTLAVDLIKSFVKKMARKLFNKEIDLPKPSTTEIAPKPKPRKRGR